MPFPCPSFPSAGCRPHTCAPIQRIIRDSGMGMTASTARIFNPSPSLSRSMVQLPSSARPTLPPPPPTATMSPPVRKRHAWPLLRQSWISWPLLPPLIALLFPTTAEARRASITAFYSVPVALPSRRFACQQSILRKSHSLLPISLSPSRVLSAPVQIQRPPCSLQPFTPAATRAPLQSQSRHNQRPSPPKSQRIIAWARRLRWQRKQRKFDSCTFDDFDRTTLPEPEAARKKLLASLLVGAGASGTLLLSILLRTMPLGKRAIFSAAPLAGTLLPYFLCLARGLPLASVGRWHNVSAIGHRLGGVGALVLPLVLVVQEAMTSSHVSVLLYTSTILAIFSNLLFGVALIPTRFPGYDIPAARGLAVGTLYGLSFLGWSLTFRFGAYGWYGPIGKLFAIIAVYAVVFSWSDAGQNMYFWWKGKYKTELGRKWFLPFEPSLFRQVFGSNLWRQPRADALQASLMTAWQGSLPTIFVALLGSASLLQLPYLLWGPASMQQLVNSYPGLARWATYQALLAVAANNFATFLVTLVVHNRLPLGHVAFYNVCVPLIPLLNIAAFCWRYPGVSLSLIVRLLVRAPGREIVAGVPPALLS